MVDAAAAQTSLGDDKRLAFTAEHVVERDPDVGVAHVGVAGVLLGLGAEADVAHDLDAGRVGGNDEHRHALVGADLGIGHRHHDEEAGVAGVGREPLLAVDHPLVTVALAAGDEQGRVGARVRLGHRVAGRDRPVEQRLEVLGLLLLGAVVGEDLRVARVRRLAPEHRRRPMRPAEQLVEQGQLELAVALTAELRAKVARPKMLISDLLLQRADDAQRPLVALVVRIAEDVVERFDLLGQEGVDPVELLLKLRIGLEVPRHS